MNATQAQGMVLSIACLLAGCASYDGKLSRPEAARVKRKFKGKFEDLEARGNQVAKSEAAADLGLHLFFYEGFTVQRNLGDGQQTKPTSCASCHAPETNFSDGLKTSVGATRKQLARRSPSLYQAFNRHFLFWDGRIDSLWAQALMPIEDIDEIGSNRLRVVREVASVPLLKQKYEAVFGPLPDLSTVTAEDAWPCGKTPPKNVPTQDEQQQQFEVVQGERVEGDPVQQSDDPIPVPEALPNLQKQWCANWTAIPTEKQSEITQAFVNVGKAIAAYETKIQSKGSEFDQMLADVKRTRGKPYTTQEIRGLELFIGKARCVRCHYGPDLTDEKFHYLGIIDTKHENASPGQHLQTSRSNWLEGAFIVYEHEFSCRKAERYGKACSRKARKRLVGGRSVTTLIDIGQRVGAGQVRTPTLRNVAQNAFWMHNGEETNDLGFAVGFYNTRPRGPQPVTVLRPELSARIEPTKGVKRTKRIKPYGAKGRDPLQKRIDRRVRGLKLRGGEIESIVAFLRTLDGVPIAEQWRKNPWADDRPPRSPAPRKKVKVAEPEPASDEPLATEPEEELVTEPAPESDGE